MTDRRVSSRGRATPTTTPGQDSALAGSISGRSDIADLLRGHHATRSRSRIARLFGVSPLTATGRAAYRSARGAIEVGDALDRLEARGTGWRVLHSVAVDEGAELDHLVIGPAGVYIVSTAVHPDGIVEASQRAFVVSDVRYPHIRNMEYEMGRVERLLSTAAGTPVEVSGILAVVDPKSLVVRQAHRDVAVIPANTIVRWLTGRATILSPTETDRIATLARLAQNWHRSDTPTDDATELRGRFDRLQSEVDRAWRRQRLWATALTVVAAGAFIVVTYAILVAAIGR